MPSAAVRTISQLKLGEHLCCFYQSEQEYQALVGSFVRQGLERGQKCLYLADAHTPGLILDVVRGAGVAVDTYLGRGQLRIMSANDIYLQGGRFQPSGIIALLKHEMERALAEGYSGLRATGEMTWAVGGPARCDALIEYEAQLHAFFPGSRCLALCQYDLRRCESIPLFQVLMTHPTVVVDTAVHRNDFYVPSAEAQDYDCSSAILRYWLKHLAARQRAAEVKNARLLAQVRHSREQLQALSQRLLEIQEAERRYLACELHDEIGQILTGLKLTLAMATGTETGALNSRLRAAQATVDDLILRVRELSLDLRPAMLDKLGLLHTLLWHFGRYTAQTKVQVNFKQTGLEGQRWRPAVETAVFRIVQEALTNVARHAQVQQVAVRIWLARGILNVQIEDQGLGFDVQTSPPTSSGLAGMRERVTALGGQLTIESAPGCGTCILAKVPLRGQEEQEYP